MVAEGAADRGSIGLRRARERMTQAMRFSCDVARRPGQGGNDVNIILVTGAHARARTLTLDWRHWAGGGLVLFTLFVAFTFGFNFVTLKWAAAVQHPWLQAIVLADQRAEMERVQERVQGHLNAMAVRLGELQAQMLRLDSMGERLAKSAGLKPSELQSLQAGTVPGRGGAESSSVPPRNLTLLEFTEMLDRLAREVDARTDRLNVLEAMLLQNSANRRFMPTLSPILAGWFSSNFGYRIDPFTGQRAFHEGIDFPAEVGTGIQAAASGTVVFAGVHPEYGKMIEIDHGNGLVTRYAHASQLLVKEGDLVVAGQKIATVGTTGRSTGPHLHFEVRLHGVPQNPARFLAKRTD
jgi:murein DD-endopeptidase MepM/ murein hydrolase activator NlpD